ncbi:gamma-aminobutyric acid receptor subunit beta-2-like isoform X2 [Xenia sp. Carnegie-2017]|uniref:gamma-aminobutyric acid receptor subunit beta-2-like isoform X2 n=1 Tax=Xenia sp. Carnegie-2017 TaxID=2897299 RepID=UPI001F0403D6|nr:gamma-aminobutyric acid receptor subunit beta-2-like isoform X2 [Xenia sp. Carnegie-2017]XP_046846287.1 gamma-aminobutyric acid receptor subunit beta-2-like isoform X2 [Xenia sp. Carnegie-2017]
MIFLFGIIALLPVDHVSGEVEEMCNRRETTNATYCLNVLLKDYDIRTRPFTRKQSVTITVKGQIQQFRDIKESTMEFTSSVFLIQKWQDPRLQHNFSVHLSLKGKEVNERLWIPDIYVTNSNQYILHEDNQLIHIHHDGNIYYSARITIVATCQMELKKFPMDAQECKLTFESYAYKKDHMQLLWVTDKPIEVINTQMAEFEIGDIESDIKCTVENVSYPAGKYSSLVATFKFKRRMGFYLIQAYFPSLIITILSWMSFYIDPKDIGERVSLGITTILTIVFLLGTNNSSMPRVSYAKAIDWYLITSFMFVFSTLIESLIVFKFSRDDDISKEENHKNKMDELKSYKPNNLTRENSKKVEAMKQQEPTSPCLVDENGETRSLYLAFAKNDLHFACCNSFLFNKCPQKAAIPNTNRKFSLSHIIDRVCRVFFPVSFLFMNVLYWSLLA